jgi:hypothetical protein
MTFSFKIVVCSLKSVKRIPSVQNDSPVMNTSGSLGSPVVNILRSLDSPVMNTQASLDSPVMNNWGADFLVYLEKASEQVNKKG